MRTARDGPRRAALPGACLPEPAFLSVPGYEPAAIRTKLAQGGSRRAQQTDGLARLGVPEPDIGSGQSGGSSPTTIRAERKGRHFFAGRDGAGMFRPTVGPEIHADDVNRIAVESDDPFLATGAVGLDRGIIGTPNYLGLADVQGGFIGGGVPAPGKFAAYDTQLPRAIEKRFAVGMKENIHPGQTGGEGGPEFAAA